MQIADRISKLGTEQAFHVLARAKEMERKGINMVHMEIGDTDFDTPTVIKNACKKAIDENKTHYLPSQGLLEFRIEIAKYISKTRGIKVEPEEVVVTPGAKPIIFYTLLATVNAGDEVIVPNPGFPTYESVVNFIDAKAVPLPLIAEKNFNFDLNLLEKLITKKTKYIIVNSPQNPTGGILTHESLVRIAQLAKEHDLWVLSDEVYDKFVFEGKFESISSLPNMKERTIILNAFTKTYSMSGWRLGYGVMNRDLAKVVSNLINNSISCSPNFTQWAGIAGLQAPESIVTKMRVELKKRRDAFVKEIVKLPKVQCHCPKGGIYLFLDIRETGKTSKEVFEILFEEAHVSTLSGAAFGKYGEGFLRLSFGSAPIPRIKEAVKRMQSVWHKIAE
ncbi:MAG: aspartate aminotransferase [Elusimicrobia bacterium RIFOXYA2_FULL_40_6]|nr:MAG: aspartate aminotransferase [Elusimicrobia bacterium RIFOXYA2_FULL_40_6]